MITRGVLVAATGVAAATVAALLLTRTLQAMLNDVQPTEPAVFAMMVVLVLVVSTIASWVPARSAGRVDPMVVLRDN